MLIDVLDKYIDIDKFKEVCKLQGHENTKENVWYLLNQNDKDMIKLEYLIDKIGEKIKCQLKNK